MSVIFNKNVLFEVKNSTVDDIYTNIENVSGLSRSEIYLEQSGRKLCPEKKPSSNLDVKVILRLNGGKGGFGSMLRAIGAQIEKTTNREACRDLSGRRLRDINEEQRLKNWLATKEEREKEAEERKKKKLERLCQTPKHEFKDENYDKERSELLEKVVDAVSQGLQASTSKRSAENDDINKKKKKKKLWVDPELEDLSSTDDDDDEGESGSANAEIQPSKSVVSV